MKIIDINLKTFLFEAIKFAILVSIVLIPINLIYAFLDYKHFLSIEESVKYIISLFVLGLVFLLSIEIRISYILLIICTCLYLGIETIAFILGVFFGAG